MKRPGSPVDPAVAAMLRQFLEQPRPPAHGAVRRAPEPPKVQRELCYLLELPSSLGGGHPHVDVQERVLVAGQKPSPWQRALLSEARVAACDDPEDRSAMAALLSFASSMASAMRVEASEASLSAHVRLTRAARETMLPLLARTGRLRLRLGGLPLAWSDEVRALRLAVEVVRNGPGEPSWAVSGLVRSGGGTLALMDIEALFEGGIFVHQGVIGRIDDGGASSWLGLLRQHRRVAISAARRAAFLEELFALPSPPPLDLPAGVTLREVSAAPRPRLFVFAPAAAEGPRAPLLFASLAFDYDGVRVPSGRAGKVAFDAAAMGLVRRDAAAESAARARVEALGIEPLGAVSKSAALPPPEGAELALSAVKLPEIVGALLAEGFTVEAAGKTIRRATRTEMGVKASGVDWFELRGAAYFDGSRVPLSALLAAVKRGESMVTLDDGTMGLVPSEWLKKHGLLARLGTQKGEALRFLPSQVPLLDALVSDSPEVKVDARFAEARAKLGAGVGRAAIAAGEVPEGFRGELRGYQREGLGWLRWLTESGFGGCLADDMGLGKTVQVLALLAGRRGVAGKPSLVVAPRSLLFNWKREAARFAPDLCVLEHTGGDRRAPGAHWEGVDLVLTTYGTLRRDAEALAKVELDLVILDEAQAIKNASSETAKAARSLCASRRLALSGTPVENHLGELWSLFEFLNPGLLGKASAFEAASASPSAETISLLGRAIRPFLLRRTKAEVAPDLPERLEETWVCELSPRERDFYDALKHHYRRDLLGLVSREGLGAARVHVLTALLRLRQAACHPGLIDPAYASEPSSKLAALVPKLVELREAGQKALVFSQFTSLLDLLRPMLEAEGLSFEHLDGKTIDRQARVDRFQNDPSCGVFLISLKAGGVGLNLTAAEYVFLLDPWWNPASEAQAIDRAHRIGQARSVFAYRLLARDTVEERIAELKRQKQALAESVIRGDRGPLEALSAEDLELLLS